VRSSERRREFKPNDFSLHDGGCIHGCKLIESSQQTTNPRTAAWPVAKRQTTSGKQSWPSSARERKTRLRVARLSRRSRTKADHSSLPLFCVSTIQFAAGRMEPKGCERHRWVKPRGRKERERISQSAVADASRGDSQAGVAAGVSAADL
jgi:hypothetical protein